MAVLLEEPDFSTTDGGSLSSGVDLEAAVKGLTPEADAVHITEPAKNRTDSSQTTTPSMEDLRALDANVNADVLVVVVLVILGYIALSREGGS